MNKYVEHIEELLYLHDCVIVPGFGGFICDYTSASINEKTGTIVPPSKKVMFNKHLKQNDGLLIDWITRKEQIDYEKAQRRLALFCEEIKVRLNQKQKVDFGAIGNLFGRPPVQRSLRIQEPQLPAGRDRYGILAFGNYQREKDP